MKVLFEAVRAGDTARVEALIAADATLAIFAASMLGDTTKLEALLTANRSLVDRDQHGRLDSAALWRLFSASWMRRACC